LFGGIKMEKIDKQIIGIFIFMIIVVTVLLAGILTREHSTHIGKVIDTDIILNDDGSVSYMILHFEDGTDLDIFSPQQSTDFTLHSQIIIEVRKNPEWLFPQEHYTVIKIIKVPDDE